MARNGYAQDFDLIEVIDGFLMQREAATQMRALLAALWEETGERPKLSETFRTIQTQQHYANTMPAGTYATPGKSFHGNGLAADVGGGVASYDHPYHAIFDRLAQQYGFNNVQGAATKSPTNPRGEAWHYVYVGNPQIRATGQEWQIMANLAAQVDFIATSLGWLRTQQDGEAQKQQWMGEQADKEDIQLDTVEGVVRLLLRNQGWIRMQQNRLERKADEIEKALKILSAEVLAPPAADDANIAKEQP